MTKGGTKSALRDLRTLLRDGAVGGQGDGDLLGRFLDRGGVESERAFAALVERHGPMVLGVCRRVLGDRHEAEDAFQAVFLVLARRAASIASRELLANWLYGVATRTALEARGRLARRQSRERQVSDMTRAGLVHQAEPDDWRGLLDEELSRLPEPYRAAIVLCDLEGLPRQEAASRLRLPEGTLSSRISRGRALLRERLSRRGVTLGAGALASLLAREAEAALPTGLVEATVSTALGVAAGSATAAGSTAEPVAKLAEGVIMGMFLNKLRGIATAGLLAAVAAAAWTFALRAEVDPPDEGKAAPPAPARSRPGSRGDRGREDEPPADVPMLVNGRVVDADGKPVPGARVAVKTYPREVRGEAGKLLIAATADGEGRFAIQIPRTPATRYVDVVAIASAPGRGLDGARLDDEADRQEVTITLDPERAVRGRLVDVTGRPVAGAAVAVEGLNVRGVHHGPIDAAADRPAWPGPATTDAEGRFTLAGLSDGASLDLVVSGDSVARQRLKIEAGEPGRSKELTFGVAPAQELEIRVTRAEDGSPIPGAIVRVRTDRPRGQKDRMSSPSGVYYTYFRSGEVRGIADERGVARVVPWDGSAFTITAEAPEGQPYLARDVDVEWPTGAVRKTVEVALRGGVVVRGRVVESESGEPVSGAVVEYYMRHRDNPKYLYDYRGSGATSDAKGDFTIVLPPGPGHLLAGGPTPDYRHAWTNHATLGSGIRPNLNLYPDAVAPLDLDAEAHEITISLRRGVKVAGRVVDPEGRPVERALLFGPSYVPFSENRFSFAGFNGGAPALVVRNGRFEAPGLDTREPSRFHVFDSERQLGAVVELSGRPHDDPPTIRLEPCGSATARFVDRDGRPVTGHDAGGMLKLVITPGAPFTSEDQRVADFEFQTNLDPGRYRALKTGADGRCAFPSLIPGARYQVEGDDFRILHEFTAAAGKNLTLPDMVLGDLDNN